MLNSDLSKNTKFRIANKNKSKKSSPNRKNDDLTKGNDSKITESKISKKSPINKGFTTKVSDTKKDKSSKISAKTVEQSMMTMSQAIHQTI